MKHSEVVVVGSINMDLVFAVPQLPRPGETATGAQFSSCPGGKGANQAVAAARLGVNTALVGCVGDDACGRKMLALLEQEGVDCTRVTRVPQPTGCAGIFVDNRGENCIAVADGANARVSAQTIDRAEAVIAGAKVLLVQLEIPLEAVRAALQIARAAGVITILDPAPARELDEDLLGLADYLTPNAGEASQLTGSHVHCWNTAAAAARELRAKSGGTVLVTMGKYGAFFSSPAGEVRITAPRVAAVDSTAAGDAFNGALAVALARGVEPDRAADIAVVAGALAATRAGAQPSLPTREQLAKAVALPW